MLPTSAAGEQTAAGDPSKGRPVVPASGVLLGMPLPDVSRLHALGDERLRDFGKRLAASGLVLAQMEAVAGVAQGLGNDRMARAPRLYHLRARDDGAARAMRLFWLSDRLDDGAARALLGDLFAPLLDAGFLVADDGFVLCPFALAIVGGIYVFADHLEHGGEAVMRPGDTTEALLHASLPEVKIGDVLDVACGPGTLALALAGRARRAIGTDISARAITFARVNAAINGVTNVEFREGDGLGAVAGETFDLVVCQPPFLAAPEAEAGNDDGADAAGRETWRFGGARGDEIPRRILADIPAALGPRGRAVVLVEWPIVDAEPLVDRVRAAVPSGDIDVLLVESGDDDLDEHAASYAAIDDRSLGRVFVEHAIARRAHFARMGIRALRLTFNVLQRGPAPALTASVELPERAMKQVSSTRIDALLAARRLLNAGDAAIDAARLRLPAGTRVVRETTLGEASARLHLKLPPATLVPPLNVTHETLVALEAIHAAATVSAASLRLAKGGRGGTASATRARVLTVARDALALGVLEVARPASRLGD